MSTINVVGQKVTPAHDEYTSLQKDFDLKIETKATVQVGAVRGEEVLVPLEAADDDLFELEYSNGLREWATAADIRARYAKASSERGQGDGIVITAIPPGSATRGAPDFILKGLKLLGIDPVGAIADKGVKATIAHFEGKLTPAPGLYRLDQRGLPGAAVEGELNPSDGPYLLLIHGTFSSIDGSFHNLFASREWADLWAYYDGRILGFNHRSLSQSPVDNSLELIGHLPQSAKLHIVSHSRGGLVGELLCLDAVTADDLAYFDKAKRIEDIATLEDLSAQLASKQLDVQRFVRVACPARGTLLASQRLDLYLSAMLNLFGLIPALAESILYDFAKATILTLIKQKTDAKELPGLEAMIPESPLVCMLNRAGAKSKADLAVVAGDLAAGGGVFNTLKTWAGDAFYWQDNDLVVHTKAMYGGLERASNVGYFFFREAPDMDHFSYFSNDKSRGLICRWLTQKPGDKPAEFHSLAQVRGAVREAARERTRTTLPDDAPAIILIPGVFASHLKSGKQRIWIDLEAMATGKLDRLAMGPTGGKSRPAVRPDGIVEEHFAALIDWLSPRYHVTPFAYDWRQSLSHEVDDLAKAVEKALQGERKVYLLAHGSGGLLARALLVYHPETWQKLCARGGRLVMLGTPNHGAYAMVEFLSGQAELMRMLDLLDGRHDLDEICRQFRRYPGLVELLPQGHDEEWREAFLATLSRSEKPNFEKLLTKADEVWQKLNGAIDAEHMCYVAGSASATVGKVEAGEKKTLVFHDSTLGDGFVTTELARLADVPVWTMDAPHGDLANRIDNFGALEDLLSAGKTGRPSKETALPAAPVDLTQRQIRLVLYPNKQEFTAAVMAGAVPNAAAATPEQTVTLKVSVLHASLEHANYPLAIGHYEGDMIVGAEAVLNSQLNDRLFQRRSMGLYPGKPETVEVLLNPQGQWLGEVKGALIIGLGEVGQITPDIVTRGVTEAALRLALSKLDLRETTPSGTAGRQPISAAFSALLIGTRGARALAVERAVASIVTGAVLANRALADRGLLDQVCVNAVEFVEIYGDLATRAAHAAIEVEKYMRITLARNEKIDIEKRLRAGEGGYAGQPPDNYDAGWWQRIQIKETVAADGAACGGQLQFLQLTDRARAELTLQATQRALVEQLVERAIHDPTTDLNLPATLYELLLPNDLKEQPLESTNMLLILDGPAAQYPWEMMAERRLGAENATDGTLEPLSVRMGMIRQLEKENFRRQVHAPHSKNALVIGDPLLDDPTSRALPDTQAETVAKVLDGYEVSRPIYPPLPGARAEAKAVASVLRGYDYAVTELIQANALTIVNELYAREYRIIHIAGHGVYQPTCPAQSGVVLGSGIYLTSAEIQQLRVVPELVFLNCCHIGRVEGDGGVVQADHQPGQRAWNKLAAGISEKLIDIGVRAVVAAGWAVNDQAAARFAETLYHRMLSDSSGEEAQFGHAVRAARHEIYRSHRSNNTWGAYQCYGDPGFILQAGEQQIVAPAKVYVAPMEFILEVQNLRSRASRTHDKGWITRYTNQLRVLESLLISDLPPKWRNGEMLTELGDAFAEFGDFETAILRYRDALAVSGAQERVPLRTVEQLANLEARFAVQLTLKDDKGKACATSTRLNPDELLAVAEERLQLLLKLAPTGERYALLGSYYKRRAITQRNDDDMRIQALKDAEAAYLKAENQPGVPDSVYDKLNQVACACLYDKQLDPDEIQTALDALAKIEAEVADKQDAGLTFWERIVRPDAALGRILLSMAGGETQHDEGGVLALYRREFEIGATVRERSTVLENLQFLTLILEAKGKPEQAAVMQRVRESLMETV